jgi:hypothetical protein
MTPEEYERQSKLENKNVIVRRAPVNINTVLLGEQKKFWTRCLKGKCTKNITDMYCMYIPTSN